MALSFRVPNWLKPSQPQITDEQLANIVRNKFNEAFFWGSIGSEVTDDDRDVKRYIDYAYNINPDVYSVVNQIQTKFTSIPYCIKDIKDEEAYRKYKLLNESTKYNYSLSQEVKAYDLKQKAFSEDEMPMPFERPNPEQTWQEFWMLTEIFLQNSGNIYWYMLRPETGAKKGEPIAIYVLPSQLMQIVVKGNITIGLEDPVDYYELNEGKQLIRFEKEDVIHIKYPNPNYDENGQHLYGQSPLRAAYKNIQSTNKGLDLSVNTMKNGGAFGFLHAKDNQTPLTEDQAKSIKDRLRDMNSNSEDLSRIAGISAAIGFTRISLTPDELKPFDYFKYNLKTLCNALGWDSKLLNDDDGAKYDNMKVAEKRVVTSKIVPDIKLLSEAFNKEFLSLIKGYENKCIEFKVKELPEMQQDYKVMTEWVLDLVNNRMITPNKGLAILGMDMSEDANMDILQVKLGNEIMSLSDALMPDEGLTI